MSFQYFLETTRNAFSRIVAGTIATLLGIALCSSTARAQSLQLRYAFEDTGTTAASSGALAVTLNLTNYSNVATDLHGAAGSGVQNQGKSFDLTSSTANGGNGPVAAAVANSTLGAGLGLVSNFTASIWFKQQTIVSSANGSRLFTMGTNGITDNFGTSPTPADNSITLFYQNNNFLVFKMDNGPILSAPIYYQQPTNVWLFAAVTYDGTNNMKIYLGSETSPAKLVAIRSIGTYAVNFGTSGTLMIGNRISNRQRAFKGWIDEFQFYTGDASANFIESIRQLSTPVLVTNLVPDGMALMQGTNTLSFNASSASGIDSSGIKVAVNGTDVSGSLTITGPSTNRSVSYTGLPMNNVLANNSSLNAVSVSINITDLAGIVTSNTYSYDAFSPTNLTVEAEDYNYSSDPLNGPGGLYIDNPRYAFESAADTYWQRAGYLGADYNDQAGGGAVYRGLTDLVATEFSVGIGANGGNSLGELMRQKVLDALALDINIREVNVGFFYGGDWQNYTRTYPAGSYNVYLRVASGASRVDNFYRVTGDTTQPGQGTNALGTFTFASTGGWQSYSWVPLRDASGNLVRLDQAGGTDTFRIAATVGGTGNGNLNFLMFAPANTNLPTITGVYPNGTNMYQPSASFLFVVGSPAGVAINTNSILLTLTRTTILGTVVTNLNATNGLTITGTSPNFNVSAALITNATYTAAVNVTDVNGNSAAISKTFDTYNPTVTLEAEDYNYNSGLYSDALLTNGCISDVGTAEVDYHDDVLTSQNPNQVYRTSDPVGIQVCGDTPPRLAYIDTGYTNYNVGWFDNGNWNNYSRTIPSGVYNVVIRAANVMGSGNSVVTMAEVTSGSTTTSQTTANLGTFLIPQTGGLQSYAWIPLRDVNGNLVKVTGTGSPKTFRATSSGGCNVNFYALILADTNLPAIGNMYPNGTTMFQKTNKFSFTVTSPVGVNTNSISVTLDGVVLTNLAFTGSSTSWNVSYMGLAEYTNHVVTISVTDFNGNNTVANARFDTFPVPSFTWESEDYDYGSGLYTTGVDAYDGLAAVNDVDFHNVSSGDPYLYRPTGTATEICGDVARSQFAGTNDYNIAWFMVGEWGNYTRQYPAGNYNVWVRVAAANGTGVMGLSKVTAGWGTTSQTTSSLGSFTVADTGAWTTYNFVPLRDGVGNMATVTFSGPTNTLRLTRTSDGDANVNFLMLVPAPGSVQLNITRNGSNADVSFLSQSGLSYQLQYKNNLTDPVWTSIGSLIAGDGSTKTISDSLGQSYRFYRLWIQQP